MAGLGWLWLVATVGCVVVLGAALYYGSRQTLLRARDKGVPPGAGRQRPERPRQDRGPVGDAAFAGDKPTRRSAARPVTHRARW